VILRGRETVDWKGEALKKVLETMPALLVVIGALFVALGAAGGVTYNNWLPITQQNWQIAIALLGVALIISGGVTSFRRPGHALNDSEYYGIKITSPPSHSEITKTHVTGHTRNFPAKITS